MWLLLVVIQHSVDSNYLAYNQMNEILCLALCVERKTYYELVVLGLLVRRMNGYLEFEFS